MSEVTTSHIHQLQRNINALSAQIEAVGTGVQAVATQQQVTDGHVLALESILMQYIQQDRLDKELQLATTRIGVIRQQLETEFGHYGNVRRRATGILQAVDHGVVTHETIQSTTEDVMMSAPGYWLAPALVALAAWARDDRPLSGRALEAALDRDLNKTALFYALVLRRFGRHETAAQWLGHFFSRQDPRGLSRDVVVLIDAVATGAFGPTARGFVTGSIDGWMEVLTNVDGFADEQRARWKRALVAQTPVIGNTEFISLRANSPSWSQLEASLAAVRRNDLVRQHFEAIFDGEVAVPRDVEEHIDGLLSSLVSDFDPEELPLRREESLLQCLIDANGDRERADQQFESKQESLVESIDFLTLMTNAAMNPDEAHASRGTQRFAAALSRDWIVDAHEQLSAATRSVAPSSIEVALDDWHGTITQQSDQAALEAQLESHFDQKTSTAVSAIKFTGGPLIAAIAIVPAAALIAASPPLGIVLMLVCALIAGVGWQRLEPRRKAAREAGDKAKDDAREALRATLVDYVDYSADWRKHDAVAEDVRSFLSGLSVDDHILVRPGDTRPVLA